MDERKREHRDNRMPTTRGRRVQSTGNQDGRPGSSEKPRRDQSRPWRQKKQQLLRMEIEDLREYLLDTEM